MQTSFQRLSVISGFVLILIVLIGNGLVIRHELGVQIHNEDWVQHTQQVLFELSQTESLITDAETGQRGFLYAEDPKYLGDYQSAIGRVQPHIDSLARLTVDNPNEQARVVELGDLSRAKLSELAETIYLYRSGQADKAKAMVKSDQGKILMDKIRGVVHAMDQEEAALQATRSAAYQKSIRITFGCVYMAGLIGVLGVVLLCYSVLRQIGLRERHARQIAEREEWFRVTLTSLGDAIMATDERGLVTFLNPVAEELIGMELRLAKGRPIVDVFPIFNEETLQTVENPVARVLETGRVIGLANHTVLKRTDGTMIPIEDSAAPIRDGNDKVVGVALVFRDATFERRSQELLRKSDKLAAAARLAATVAHEINNPLEAVTNLVYIAANTADLPPSVYENLTLAEQELERVSHITRQTLGFYRETKNPDKVLVSEVVDSILRLFANRFQAKQIKIERDYRECPPVLGLAGELKQVVANLITNAADAVPEGGTIRIALACVPSGEGDVLQMSIMDDGSGIETSIRERIFEPFFTTKKDVGTGLGLWITKEIVDRHGGEIEVQSRDEGDVTGTIFNVRLPLADRAQSSGAPA